MQESANAQFCHATWKYSVKGSIFVLFDRQQMPEVDLLQPPLAGADYEIDLVMKKNFSLFVRGLEKKTFFPYLESIKPSHTSQPLDPLFNRRMRVEQARKPPHGVVMIL